MPVVILTNQGGAAPIKGWTTLLDGASNDFGIGMVPHSSGNVYGSGQDNSGQAIITYKLNSSGSVQWQRSLQTSTGASSGLNQIAIDASENVYIASNFTVSVRGRLLVAKYNSSGTIQWQRTLYNTGYSLGAEGIALDSSNNVYVVGNSFNHTGSVERGLVVKYDSAGNFQWEREIAAPTTVEEVTLYGITVDDNGDLIIVGRTDDDGTLDTLVMKINPSGSPEGSITWQKYLKLRAPTFAVNGTFGVVTDSSNNIYVTGQTWDTTQDGYVAKLNSSGTLQWARGIDDAATSDDVGQTVDLDSSGNVYVAARKGTAGSRNIRLMQWDSDGVIQWKRQFGGTADDLDATIKIDDSGLIYLVGTTSNGGVTGTGIFTAKLNNLGTFGSFTYTTDTVNESEARTFTVSDGALTSAGAGVFTEAAAGLTETAASLTETNNPED